MAWYDEDSWATAAFAPKLSAIIVSFLVAFLVPILLHHFIYRKAAPTAQPTFLLIGPSGGGKTAFLTLVRASPSTPNPNTYLLLSQTERKTVANTHTSTAPLTIEATLPDGYKPNSAAFRSPGDPAYERARHFVLVDTPGHGKLRRHAIAQLANPANVRGIIFVVDAALVSEEPGLVETAEYLHDVLLALQKRSSDPKAAKGPKEIPVLIAANKLDLFTALPPHLVKLQLEKAITQVRRSRAKGLRSSSATLAEGDDGMDEERDWLGEGGEGDFDFTHMEEVGTSVDVQGGNLLGGQGPDVKAWLAWIAERL